MPVDEEIDLSKPLTDAELRKLERDAERMEKAAEKAEIQRQKIDKEVSAAANTLLEAEKFMGTSPLNSMGGNDERPDDPVDIIGIGKSQGATGLPSKGRRVGQSREKSPIQGISVDVVQEIIRDELKETKENDKRQNAELKILQNSMKERQLHEQQIKGNVSGGMGKINEAFAFKKNPIGMGMNKILGVVGKAGIYGAVAVMVFQFGQQMYDQIINEVKDLYKPGGVLDVRKDTLNALNQVANLEHMIDVHQGRVFFTSSTGESLRQGVPQDYNTRNKINGYKQYLQEFDR